LHAKSINVDEIKIFIKGCLAPFSSLLPVRINTANDRYTLNPKGTCHTCNVIYILTCKFCDAFYVGETGGPLNMCVNNNHRHFFITNKPDAPVSTYRVSQQQFWPIFPGYPNPHFTLYDQHLNMPSVGGALYSWFKRENVSWT